MTASRWERISVAKSPVTRRGGVLALLVLAVWLVMGFAAAYASDAPVAVRSMGMSGQGDVVRLSFDADAMPSHRLDVSAEPARAVIRFDNVSFIGLAERVDVGDGTVETVEFVTGEGGNGEIIVTLARSAGARMVQTHTGFDLVITPGVAEAKAKLVQGPVDKVTAPAAQATPAVNAAADGLTFHFGQEPSSVTGVVLSDGRRMVIDVYGVELGGKELFEEYEDGDVTRVVVRPADGMVRAVVETKNEKLFDGYTVDTTDSGFVLRLPDSAPPTQVAAAPAPAVVAPVARPTVMATRASAPAAAGGGEVFDFGFRQDATKSYVDIVLSADADHEVTEATGTRVVLDIKNTRLPKKFQRALDTSAFSGPVRLVAAYGRKADTRVVVDLKTSAPFTVEPRENGLALAFEGGSEAMAEAKKDPGTDKLVLVGGDTPPPTEGTEGSAIQIHGTGAPVGQYSGRRISMDFVDADIRNVLRLIGEVANLNIVAGSEVTGKVTLRLVDVPWDQAFAVILEAKGLGAEQEGNVVRVISQERIDAKIAKQREEEEAEKKRIEEARPLINEIFPVNYAAADEILNKVEAVLSERGTATVDERTNTILVQDLEAHVEKARELVSRLDTPTPQVLIEARIVEVSSTYSKDLGVQWGGEFTADAAHGNSTGWAFPNSIGLKGDTGLENYAVNFPSAGGLGGGPGGALALSLGHIDDILSLDLRLSAIETSGKGRVVSSPRVTTLDNRPAEIEQGVEIPFTTATEEKIETQSIDYLLKLNVTPHVTSDDSIVLKIEVIKDAPSTTFFAADSNTPAVETRKASTEVLVRDGETTVIGGIITDTTSESVSGIPWFQKIPFIGWMFKQNINRVDKTELIIFITPKIVKLDDVARSL